MPLKNTIFISLFFLAALGTVFLSTPHSALAATVYVEDDGDDSNDGSADHPYETLKKAAEEVNEGDADEVRIGKGSFEGNATFDQGVSIQGKGKGATTITGPLTFKKKTEVKDLSVKTTAHNAIVIGKNGNAKIKNIDVRDYTGVGIWLTAGNAVLTLEDSRIGGSSGKGIYAEAGSKLTMAGNSIVNNKQEGIDIRQNTRGAIKNNSIEDNDESGIELIVGSSDFVISGNDIKKNGASGIAYQFYDLNKKFGTITASNNTISGHHRYGIDCKKPQGGNSPTGYWADSITLDANTFSNNGKGEISTSCKLIEAKTEEEEKKLEEVLIAEQKVEETASATPPVDPAVQEKANQENQAAEGLVSALEGVIGDQYYQDLKRQLDSRNKGEVLWHGFKGGELDSLRREIENDTNEILSYQDQLAELEAYETRADLQERVTQQEEKLVQYQNLLTAYEQKKGAREYISLDMVSRVHKFFYAFFF